MRDEYTNPENGIAAELMHAHRRLLQYSTQAMDAMNIGVGQVIILKLLKEKGTMTQRQIADESRVTPATVCGTLKRMERAGLIYREADLKDARVSCVTLTKEGAALCDEAIQAMQETSADMLAGFSDEECVQLYGLLKRMSANLLSAMERNEEVFEDENR